MFTIYERSPSCNTYKVEGRIEKGSRKVKNNIEPNKRLSKEQKKEFDEFIEKL